MTAFASLSCLLRTGAAVAAIAIPSVASAQAVSFDLPPEDLAGSLRRFAVQTNVNLLYSPDLVANRRSAGVSGRFTPEAALGRLLQGTDVGFRRTAPGTFVLQRSGGNLRAASTSFQPVPATPTAPPAPEIPAAPRVREGAPGSLGGIVLDGATGTALAGATVRVNGTSLSAVTDERGVYRISPIPPGDYGVTLDYLGEAPQTVAATIESEQTATLNFTRGGVGADIVVVGYTSAIQGALNRQRAALNNSTIISEDLLGGFPAETVSEALRRVPGVAFGRDAQTGEGSRITVRGFTSEAINVQVNGLELQGTNFERTVDLSGYLAENIQTITIHKSLLPSHEATGSGGLVQIETRSGLDYGNFTFSASVEGERAAADGFGREFQANATIGGKITPNLGLVASIAYRDTSRRNFDVGITDTLPEVLPNGFTSVTFVPGSRQFPFDDAFNSRLITSANYDQRERDETNLTASINLAWDVADHTRLRLDLQRNDRDALTTSSRSIVGFLTGAFEMPTPELNGEIRRRTTLASFRPTLVPTVNNLNIVTDTVSLRGDTNLDDWTFRYKAGYASALSRSANSTMTILGDTFTNLTAIMDPATVVTAPDDDPARTQRIIRGGFVQLENGMVVPALTPAGLDILMNPATYRILSAARTITNSPTEAYTGEASARRRFGGFLDYIEVGFKYDRSERAAVDELFATTNTGTLRTYQSFAPIAGRNTYLSDIDPTLIGTSGFGAVGIGFLPPTISAAGNQAIFDAMERLLVDDPSTPFNEARFTFTDFSQRNPVNETGALIPTSSTETRYAGYVEAHVEFGKFDVVGGLRVEHTQRVGRNLSVPSVTLNLPGIQNEPRATFVAADLVDYEELNATDTFFAPSFLINYRPRDNIVARLGYFRSTVAPSIQLLRRQNQIFIDLRPNVNRVILAEGNPDLEPTVTNNFDLDLAYYFQGTPGLVRFGAFYKTTSNNFTNVFTQDAPTAEIRDRVLDRFGSLATTRPDLVAFDNNTEFLLRRPRNGEGGVIWGIEAEIIRQFNFLPGFLSGFGVIANLTYTSGDFPTLVSGRNDAGGVINVSLDRPLEDQAAWVYNAALTYARSGFEGRLIYTRQSVTVEAYEIHDLNTVIPAYSTLDLRLSYSFRGPGRGLFTIFLEGDDLLRGEGDPDIRRAIGNTPGREDAEYFFPRTMQFNGGRMFTLGARVRF